MTPFLCRICTQTSLQLICGRWTGWAKLCIWHSWPVCREQLRLAFRAIPMHEWSHPQASGLLPSSHILFWTTCGSSFHSLSSNSFKTTLSHQMLRTRMQHVCRDLLCSREAAKFNNKFVVCIAPTCNIRRWRLRNHLKHERQCESCLLNYHVHNIQNVQSHSFVLLLICHLSRMSRQIFLLLVM